MRNFTLQDITSDLREWFHQSDLKTKDISDAFKTIQALTH